MFKKMISLFLSLSLIITQPIFAQGVAQLNLAQYLGQMRPAATDSFRPTQLRYFSYDNLNNSFRILLDKGDTKDIKDNQLKQEAKELMDYFLIGVTLPNDVFWVNLRPDSPENIIDPELEKTGLGRILLEADLQLKKDTASLTSPQTPEGKAYWDKLYKKAGELFGTENITIPTITRPWIVPGEIIVRESQGSAFIYKAALKVMLEADYLRDSPLRGQSLNDFSDPRLKELNQYSSQLIRESIIPKLTQEVNSSKRYARLRQVYYSLVLSRWFKMRFSGKSGQYADRIDKHDLTGLTSQEPYDKLTYFKQYQESFAKGEYNLKEPVYTPYGQTIRTYMSGGFDWRGITKVMSGSNTKVVGSPIEEQLTNRNNVIILDEDFTAVKTGLSAPLAASSLQVGREYFKQFRNIINSIYVDEAATEYILRAMSKIEARYNKAWLNKDIESFKSLIKYTIEEQLDSFTKYPFLEGSIGGATAYDSPEFLVGDLDNIKLGNAFKDARNKLANKIVLQELGLSIGEVRAVSEDDLLQVFNKIIRMRDFHNRIDVGQYKSMISKEIQQLLTEAQMPESTLKDKDYLKLNKGLLEAIYQQKTRKVPSYAIIMREVISQLRQLSIDLGKATSPPALQGEDIKEIKSGVASNEPHVTGRLYAYDNAKGKVEKFRYVSGDNLNAQELKTVIDSMTGLQYIK